jgi:hypothetical protein
MNLRLLSVPTLAIAIVACDHGGGLKGSGTLKTESRNVSGFTQIALDSMGDVTLSQTGTESLTIEAEDNLLPHLRTTVSGGRLTLDTDGSLQPTKPIHYTIGMKDITGLDISGAGNVTGTQLHTSAIVVRVSGAGDLTLSGQADRQDVDLSGAGNYHAPQLATKTAKVTVSGAGNATVQVSDALDVNVSGAGNVDYSGDPKVTKHVDGAGSVRKR